MNVQAGDNGIRYVFAVSSSNNKHTSHKVSVENVRSRAVGHLQCKKIAGLQEIAEEIKETNGDDVELTIISASEDALIVGHTLDSENTIDEEPVSKKRRPDVAGERSASQSKLILSNDHLLVRSGALGNYSHTPSTDDDDTEYIPLNNYHTKCVPDEVTERRHGKYKVFRDEWLDIDIFRDWLDRDPTNPRKARCVACNTTMNAGKSELEKHAAGARHERAVETMHQTMLQQLAAAEAEADQDAELEEHPSNETRQIHSVSLGAATEPVVMEQTINPEEIITVQQQQIDVMNRVATAIETLSNNITSIVERMTEQQGTLIAILQALQRKVCSKDNTD